jgi:hypothetical protein
VCDANATAALAAHRGAVHSARMSFLLPRTSLGTVLAAQLVSIHDDRYVDLRLALDDAPDAPVSGRIGAADCPQGLAPGERIEARVVLGSVVGVKRAAP